MRLLRKPPEWVMKGSLRRAFFHALKRLKDFIFNKLFVINKLLKDSRKVMADNPAAKRSSIGWRPDIDGLRALAVFAVFAFHAFPKLKFLKGGFVGVDVFFVISGFLISSILYTQLAKGTFSFWDFYSRRIRRIYPVC